MGGAPTPKWDPKTVLTTNVPHEAFVSRKTVPSVFEVVPLPPALVTCFGLGRERGNLGVVSLAPRKPDQQKKHVVQGHDNKRGQPMTPNWLL